MPDLPVKGPQATTEDGISQNTTESLSNSTRQTVSRSCHQPDAAIRDLFTTSGKRYTLILKDELLPRNPENGRDQATISYEYDFETKSSSAVKSKSSDVHQHFFIPWSEFKPTYRGKEKKDAKKLDPSNIKRISIMMRR